MRKIIRTIALLMGLLPVVVSADPTSIPPAVVSSVTVSNADYKIIWPPMVDLASSNGIVLTNNPKFLAAVTNDTGVTNIVPTNALVAASRISGRDLILGTNATDFTMPLSITGEEFVVNVSDTNWLVVTHVGSAPGPSMSDSYERDYGIPFYFLATGKTISSPDGGNSWYMYPNGTDITWENNSSGTPVGMYTPMAPGDDGTPYGTVTVVYAVLTNLVFADTYGIRATHLGGLPASSYPTGMTVNGQAATMSNQNLSVTIPVGGETVAPYPEFLLTLGGAWTDFEIKASTNNFGRPAVLGYVVAGTAAADTYTLTTNMYDGFVVLLGSGDNAIWHNASMWHVGYGWTGGGASETALAGILSSAVLPPTGVWGQEFGGEDATVTLATSDPGVVYYYSSWTPQAPGYEDSDPYAYFAEDNVGDVRAWRKQVVGLPISSQIDQYSVIPRVYFSPSTNFPKYGDWMNKTNNHVVWSYIIVDDLGFRTNPVSGNQTWELIQPYNWAKDRVVP